MSPATGDIPISHAQLHTHVIHPTAARSPKHAEETLRYSAEAGFRLLSSQGYASRLSHLLGISHQNKII